MRIHVAATFAPSLHISGKRLVQLQILTRIGQDLVVVATTLVVPVLLTRAIAVTNALPGASEEVIGATYLLSTGTGLLVVSGRIRRLLSWIKDGGPTPSN